LNFVFSFVIIVMIERHLFNIK